MTRTFDRLRGRLLVIQPKAILYDDLVVVDGETAIRIVQQRIGEPPERSGSIVLRSPTTVPCAAISAIGPPKNLRPSLRACATQQKRPPEGGLFYVLTDAVRLYSAAGGNSLIWAFDSARFC